MAREIVRKRLFLAAGALLAATSLLLAWPLLPAAPHFMAGSQGISVDAGSAFAWQPYVQGLPAYAMAVTVAMQPNNPAMLYAGTYEPPGLWRSDDGGRSWIADDAGLGGSPVYAVHWDAVRGRWWVAARAGLYTRRRTSAAWQPAGLREHVVYALAEDDEGQLYAAAADGLFRSNDADNWQSVPLAAGQAGPAALAIAVSADGRTLLVGTAGAGPWVSRDGGATWAPAAGGPPEADQALAQAYVSAVLLDPRPGGAAYASTTERAYRSADGGVTWRPIADLEGRIHAFTVGADGSVYAALTGQVARSADGGGTWAVRDAGLRPGDKILDLAVSPADPAMVYAAAWDGLYASSDRGQSWQRRSDGLGYPDVNVLAWDAAGSLLAGTRSGLYRKAPGSATWSAVPDLQGRPVLSLAVGAGSPHPYAAPRPSATSHASYAGCSGGLFRSADGGQTWAEVVSELSSAGIAGLAVDPADPDHLHAWVAFGRVHESHDGGRNWVARWEGLGDVRPVATIHRSVAGQLYAGAEDALFRWDAEGLAWQPLPFPGAAPTVFVVMTDARDPATLYAGATDGLWRSPDGGRTWRRWGMGLAGRTVTALAVSPSDDRIAFAGTRHMGLYLTDDGGATWRPAWDGCLTAASVRDILFSPDGQAVYVASDRGIWQGVGYGAH